METYYNQIATSYNKLHEAEQQSKVEIVRGLLKDDFGLQKVTQKLILDIGCGTGISASLTHNIRLGLDPSKELLNIANNKRIKSIFSNDDIVLNFEMRSNHYGYLLGISEHLPIKNKSIDIVTSITAIHNFNDIKKAIIEIERVTRFRAIISVFKRTKRIKEIKNELKDHFEILKTTENEIDVFFYLKPRH